MTFRKLSAMVCLLTLAAPSVFAGNLDLRRTMLFNGNAAVSQAADTLEQVSPWIPVQGASRIFFRTWTAKAAFSATTDADSNYADSITVFRVALTDSVKSTNPLVGADSVVFTASAVDTNSAGIRIDNPPVNKQLRGPGNGSGIITWVLPITPGLATADNNGYMAKRYMRVLYTPLTRKTVSGALSTTPNRTQGLKGLRMEAVIIRANQ